MEWLIDCDIIEYCKTSPIGRSKLISDRPYAPIKPSYVLPIFEVCRAFHLLYKHGQMRPRGFRKCWTSLSDPYWGEWLHVSEYPEEDLPREIIKKLKQVDSPDQFPSGETAQQYWGHSRALTEHLRALAKIDPIVENQIGSINGPLINDGSVGSHSPDSRDMVIDTNNFIELINQLPREGLGVDLGTVHLPNRLSEKARSIFRDAIGSFGVSHRLIVPLVVMEEAERVVNYAKNTEEYRTARSVIQAMAISPDFPLWNIFSFEPLNQEILFCLMMLYEGLFSPNSQNQNSFGFADAIILSHGIYNHCPVASNEWFEKTEWQAVEQVFPFLVLKDD